MDGEHGFGAPQGGGEQEGAAARCIWLRFEVSDTGIGIALEDQSRLFKPFSRIVSPISSKILGTGLGLYLTKKNGNSISCNIQRNTAH